MTRRSNLVKDMSMWEELFEDFELNPLPYIVFIFVIIGIIVLAMI